MKNFFKVVFSRAVFTGAFIALQFAAVYLAITRFNEHFAIFYGVCLVLSAVVVVYLVSRDGNPAYKIAWIIPILALPVFGVGTIMVPWGALTLLRGDTFTGLGLLAVYGAASLTRTFLEPRFLGRQIGLSPLLTLVCLYAGFRLYGILGMILLPVAVILCKQVIELLEPER